MKGLLIFVVLGTIKELFASNYRSYYEWQAKEQKFVDKPVELPSNSNFLQPGFFSGNGLNEQWKGESQAKQDVLVRDIFQGMKNGYFLDIAANDWFELSNTYRLERYLNWTGICVEPNPKYRIGLLSNRKCQLFTNPVGQSDNESIPFRFADVVSGFIGEDISDNNDKMIEGYKEKDHPPVQLETVTFQKILHFANAPRVINYMSLDIEGAEYFAMKRFPFHQYTIHVLTIERPNSRLHITLARNGYLFVKVLVHFGDCLYVHSSFPNLKEFWQKYYKDNPDPHWFTLEYDKLKSEHAHYLLKPKWKWDPSQYVQEAKKLIIVGDL